MPPLYEHRCATCGVRVEEYRPMAQSARAPKHCGRKMPRVYSPPMVMVDIDPYQAVAADKETGKMPVIHSRKQHREFLRRNNYEEAGNDPFVPTPEDRRPTATPEIDIDLF